MTEPVIYSSSEIPTERIDEWEVNATTLANLITNVQGLGTPWTSHSVKSDNCPDCNEQGGWCSPYCPTGYGPQIIGFEVHLVEGERAEKYKSAHPYIKEAVSKIIAENWELIKPFRSPKWPEGWGEPCSFYTDAEYSLEKWAKSLNFSNWRIATIRYEGCTLEVEGAKIHTHAGYKLYPCSCGGQAIQMLFLGKECGWPTCAKCTST